MPKGQFVVMKTGFYPMKVKLKLFFKWGIKFEKEYVVPENGNRKVAYAEKKELLDGIVKKYRSDWIMDDDIPPNAMPVGGVALTESEKNISKRETLNKAKSKKTGGSTLRTTPRNVPIEHHRVAIEDIGEVEVERNGQT